MKQKGFASLMLIFVVVILATIGLTVAYLLKSSPLKSPISSPTSQETFLQTPLTTPQITPSPTPTRTPTSKPATPRPATPKPTSGAAVKTNSPSPTNTPQPATPTPTMNYSQEAPVLTVSGPYTVGESGPCFDLSSKHPYQYSQSANFRFTQTESDRYTNLQLVGDTSKVTVCWEKDPSKTGLQYVFTAQAYTNSTPTKVYSNEVSITYTHP